MEAKASAAIIGALPFIVAGLISVTSPGYMNILFTTEAGKVAIAASGVWMVIGLAVMKKMIAFDF
jgi:tight adherence protein B